MATLFFRLLSKAPPWLVRILRNGPFAHAAIYRLTRGRVAKTFAGVPVLLMTTYGRKSGKRFTTPVMFLADGDDRWIVVAGGTGAKLPSWYLNLRANEERAMIQVRERRMHVHTELVSDEERPDVWERLKHLWPGYQEHQESANFEFPLVRLTPASSGT